MEDERYAPGKTIGELRAYFAPNIVQSFRENPYWRQPGNVALLYALDLIDAMEIEHGIVVRMARDRTTP